VLERIDKTIANILKLCVVVAAVFLFPAFIVFMALYDLIGVALNE